MGHWMSLDLRQVEQKWRKVIFWGVPAFKKKNRIKEFNPRLIYFHYLQD